MKASSSSDKRFPETPPEIEGSNGPLAQTVYNRLVAMLIRGEMAPGTPIREAALCQQLKMNRGAVREALNQLVGMDVMEYTPYCGYRLLPYTGRDVMEWLQYRQAIEPMALRLLLRRPWNARVELMAELEELLKREAAAIEAGDQRSIGRCDFCFHLKIVEGSGNRRLGGSYMRNALPYLIHLAQQKKPGDAGDFMSEYEGDNLIPFLERHTHRRHEELLREMREGEPGNAVMMLRRHLRFAEENIRENIISSTLKECPTGAHLNADSIGTIVKTLME